MTTNRYEVEAQAFARRVGVIVIGFSALVVVLAVVIFGRTLVENVDADEIMVVQSPLKGRLTWHTTPGVKWQGGGKVTTYKRRSIYTFQAPVQFNDGGKGTIHGSIQMDMPLDVENLNGLHSRFGSMEAINKQVLEVVTNKVIYMTGPTMSSTESYAEKRNYLINYVQDQIDFGVYQTRQATREEKDQFSGQDKTVTYAEIIVGSDGRPLRQEKSVVAEFGIHAFNFAISQIDYSEEVEKQIRERQAIFTAVQTSVAEAQKAQQAAITATQQGIAEAAKATAEANVLKAKAVTDAQMKLEVAQKDNEAAEQYRQATLKRADADSRARKMLMEADGALDMRLKAEIEKTRLMADAIKGHAGPWVPSVVMGGSGAGTSGLEQLFQLMASERALGLSAPSGRTGGAAGQPR